MNQTEQPRHPRIMNIEAKLSNLQSFNVDLPTYESIITYRERMYLQIDLAYEDGIVSRLEQLHLKYKVSQVISKYVFNLNNQNES